MRKSLLLVFLAINCFAYGQISDSCKTIRMKTPIDIKNCEPCILQYTNYVLMQKLWESGETGHEARTAILAWMDKTPDYTFALNSEIMKVCKGDNVLLFGVYTTCLAKAALTTQGDFNQEAIRLFVGYIRNPESNVKMDGKATKLIDAFDRNDYQKYYKQ